MTVASELSFFASADGDIAYVDAGQGDLVVLLHSGFVDHRVFEAQIPALAAEYRVIAVDVRGHGFTANATKPFRWADDLADLLRHLDAGPAALVGVSMGGGIAGDTAIEYPELVRGIVLSGASVSDFEYTDPQPREFMAESTRMLHSGDIEGWLKGFRQAVAGPRRTTDEVDPGILERVTEMALHTLSKHTPGERNWHVPMTDTWSRVPKIDVPVLTVNGALDAPDLIADAERYARTVRNGRSVLIEGTSHYPNMEKPEEFNGILLDFLRSL
ncbi:alpha/beta hydrolase [Streptomyces sp. ISL-22]|uniref:alpha/beta fold hydrolase n=1 Tax=unclassified Streptomyces TaxID=2593676 RepID=UPI001BE6F9B6|nr:MULTISPECIES: alpha/beta hydrolase [unclassified Streptomyces]MBT2416487.1 alpha/beta hydrolase [Streptomyces sp. ISL-24]MBT2435776.1 alpha/beta hydrolase [Streptomyces sp. ISL-22]